MIAIPLLGLVQVIASAVAPPQSDPATLGDSVAIGESIDWVLRIIFAASAAIAALLGPGLVLRRRAQHPLWQSLALVWIPGLLILAAGGAVTWLLAGTIDPGLTSGLLMAALLSWLAWAAATTPARSLIRPGEARVFGVVLLLLLIGIGKATWSPGPQGEWLGGSISRTLEASDRPDSRLQYQVVQLIANDGSPNGDLSAGLFFPSSFSDRGALAALVAAPIVLSSGAEPPTSLADQGWVPFDREGFASYRITLMALAATILLSVFGLVRTFASRSTAWRATVLVALTPFVVHETYFTWPKLLAASFGVAALAAIIRHRPAIGGLLLGVSYLAHPVGLFIALAVVGIWIALAYWGPGPSSTSPTLADMRARLPAIGRTAILIAGGLLVPVIAWRLVNAGDFSQDTFFSYLTQGNGVSSVGLEEWLASRGRSISNTLVPLALFAWHHGDPHINPVGQPDAPAVIPFSFQYWNTLPFGVGIVYFPMFVAGLWWFARHSVAVFAAGVLIPFAVFAIYWGSFDSGLMREGLQGWLIFALLAAFLGHSVLGGERVARWANVVRACVTLRGLEVLAMLAVPTIATDSLLGPGPFVLTDLLSLAAMIGGVVALMAITWSTFAPPVPRTPEDQS